MKKFVLLMIFTLGCVCAKAADFRVDGVEYKVTGTGPNTVELKNGKKAVGDFVVPSEVTDPKTNIKYEVTSIGQGAFKKSKITSVTIPSTVTNIENWAFENCSQLTSATLHGSISEIPYQCFYNCTSLKSVDIDFSKIRWVGPMAFANTDLGTVAPAMYAVMGDEILTRWEVYPKGSEVPSIAPVIVYPYPIAKNLNLSKILGEKAIIIFADKNASEEAMSLWENILPVLFPENPHHLSSFLESDGRSWSGVKYRSFREYFFSGYPNEKNIEPEYNVYFGIEETENGTPLKFFDAIDKSYSNKKRKDFIVKLNEFVRVAVEEPEKLYVQYRKIEESETVKYDDLITKAVIELCDSVYFVKPTLSDAELKNASGFINNLFMHIGAEYGLSNMTLSKWAQCDILTHDLDNDAHKEDYQRILNMIDRLFTFQKPSEDPYHQTMQLAALCGLERWKEAASYFPKVHRSVTANGVYGVPYELEYMQDAINKHGYKAIAPKYTKTAARKGNSGGSSLIEFFGEAIAEAAVEAYTDYRQRRAYRNWLNNIDREFENNLKKGKIKF